MQNRPQSEARERRRKGLPHQKPPARPVGLRYAGTSDARTEGVCDDRGEGAGQRGEPPTPPVRCFGCRLCFALRDMLALARSD